MTVYDSRIYPLNTYTDKVHLKWIFFKVYEILQVINKMKRCFDNSDDMTLEMLKIPTTFLHVNHYVDDSVL